MGVPIASAGCYPLEDPHVFALSSSLDRLVGFGGGHSSVGRHLARLGGLARGPDGEGGGKCRILVTYASKGARGDPRTGIWGGYQIGGRE